MTDHEFEILDELYFVKTFDEIMKVTDFQEDVIKNILLILIKKGWIRYYFPIEKEIQFDSVEFETHFKKYYYIATKAGLIAHNGKEV